MADSPRFIWRETESVAPFSEICGDIRGLIDGTDNVAADVYFVEVHDAEPHFHKKTAEFYYILDGEGTMILDENTVALHKGVLVYIAPGVVHQAASAKGRPIKTLVIAVPSGLADDIFAPDGEQFSMH